MKLKHFKTIDCSLPITVNTDPYVCMDIVIGDEIASPPPLYWRLVGGSFSLVMIGIDRNSGQLMSAKVVLYNDKLNPLSNQSEKGNFAKISEGAPCFSLELWEKPADVYDVRKDFCDMAGKCLLELGTDKLHITLFPDQIAYITILADKISCEFNRLGELCGIVVKDLSFQEIQTLKEYSDSHG